MNRHINTRQAASRFFLFMLALVILSGCFNEDEHATQLESILFETGIQEAPDIISVQGTPSGVRLVWMEVALALHYFIFVGVDSSAGFVRIGESFTGTSAEIVLSQPAAYRFYVVAVSDAGQPGPRSNIAEFDLPSPLP